MISSSVIFIQLLSLQIYSNLYSVIVWHGNKQTSFISSCSFSNIRATFVPVLTCDVRVTFVLLPIMFFEHPEQNDHSILIYCFSLLWIWIRNFVSCKYNYKNEYFVDWFYYNLRIFYKFLDQHHCWPTNLSINQSDCRIRFGVIVSFRTGLYPALISLFLSLLILEVSCG